MKSRLALCVLSLVLLLALVIACAPQKAVEQVVSDRSLGYAEAPALAPKPAATFAAGGKGAEASTENVSDRMIITTVDMSIVVDDTEKTLVELQGIATAYAGYVSDSRKWFVDEQPYARITMRIPSAKFDEVMAMVRGMAVRVETENIGGKDVTEEYTDLTARLKNLEAVEKELLALMTEIRENRGKAEDILAVYRELTSVRSQIESLKGRMQYLERMTDLATLNISIRPKAAPKPIAEAESWNILVILNRALRAFVSVVHVLVTLTIYLLVFSPIVLVPAFLIWLLVRAARRRRAKRVSAK